MDSLFFPFTFMLLFPVVLLSIVRWNIGVFSGSMFSNRDRL